MLRHSVAVRKSMKDPRWAWSAGQRRPSRPCGARCGRSRYVLLMWKIQEEDAKGFSVVDRGIFESFRVCLRRCSRARQREVTPIRVHSGAWTRPAAASGNPPMLGWPFNMRKMRNLIVRRYQSTDEAALKTERIMVRYATWLGCLSSSALPTSSDPRVCWPLPMSIQTYNQHHPTISPC